MRPAFLDNMSWAMAEVYGAVTDRIMINLAKYFPYIKDSDEVTGSFEYQARMLAQMGQVNRETAQIIAGSLDGADAALRGALETAIMDALKNEEPMLRKAAEQGLLHGAGFLPPEVDAGQMQAFQSFYRQSADKLNLVNTVMLESTEQAYRATVADVTARINRTQSILNTATGEVVTGVSSWNTAVHDAVQKMVDNGLTGFVDHGGHRWSPEAYVAMDVRTTMFNTARAAVAERAEQYGADLYQVSSHAGARPLCYPWQGKVISRSDWTGEVEDLDGNKVHVYAQSETSYGQAAGLFGVNCKHYPMTFIPGFSTLKGEPQDPEENEKAYEESQQQRALERKLREEKRDLEVMKAQGADPEAIKAQRAKVAKASSDIDDFCEETGRARRRNREYTPVNAKFPPKDSYNPAEFPTEQRDRINDWFRNGGDNPPPQPTNIHLGPDNIPPQGQAQIPIEKAAKRNPKTLQMFDEATEWANDNFKYEMENLREGWSTVPSQIEAFDQFEREIPTYEKALKSAIDREEFSTRTTPRAVQQILEDGRLKSQIETGASGGYLDVEKRKRTTSNLFAGGEPIELEQQEYEIYGYLGNAPRAKMYGDSRIVFKKNNLIDRTTVTVGDSLELLSTGADPMPSLATNPKIISGGTKVFSDSVPNAPQRLNDTRRDFESINEKGYLAGGNYVELQFHGGVTVDDIEYIEVSKSANNAKEIANLAKEKGVKIIWK